MDFLWSVIQGLLQLILGFMNFLFLHKFKNHKEQIA
jgi:hypothetical protein